MFKIEILKTIGSCNDELFKTMAENSDIYSTNINKLVDKEFTLKGISAVKIIMDEKDPYVMYYIDTLEYGILSTGSKIFIESLEKYNKLCKRFIIKQLKTKQGHTFKPIPILGGNKNTEESEEKIDLPF